MPKEADKSSEDKGRSRSSTKKLVALVLVILTIIILLGVSVYFYTQYQQTQSLLKDPTQAQKSELNSLIQKVGRHYALPDDDQVTLATVSDITKLAGQSFFAKAQNGDKVLIYPKSGLAILYRPSMDKIVNVGPVNTQTEVQAQEQATTSSSVRVALFNGTSTTGLTKRVEDALKTLSSLKTEVALKDNAVNDYAESVVVDLTGKNKAAATQLATFVKGKVSSLPDGEVTPENVDIVIFLGQSYVGEPTATPTVSPTPAQ